MSRSVVSGEEVDLAVIDRMLAEHGDSPSATIPLLQAIQAEFRYLPEQALAYVCRRSGISRARIAEAATFYRQFRLKPVGRFLVRVCHGTACHVAGAPKITDAIRRDLGIEGDEDTDTDRMFTVEKVACLGCCSLAPCLMIEDVTYGRLTPRTAPLTLRKFLKEYDA